MFLSSNPIMRTTSSTTPSPLPDLSLQISPPSVSADFEAKEVSYDGLITRKAVLHSDRSSTTDSGSSGSDLSHENGGFYPAGAYNLGLTEPTLSLGFEMSDLSPPSLQLPRNYHQHHHHQHQHHHHHNHQPQIYGREFKRNARLISGVKRSVRAPRMRWTTTLHAHFVHAVELLGGHESNNIDTSPRLLFLFIYFAFNKWGGQFELGSSYKKNWRMSLSYKFLVNSFWTYLFYLSWLLGGLFSLCSAKVLIIHLLFYILTSSLLLFFPLANRSNTKVCVRVDECEGSNPSSREESFAGGG